MENITSTGIHRRRKPRIDSETPLAFHDTHYLQQIELRGTYKTKETEIPLTLPGSNKSQRSLKPLHVTISITDIINIDTVLGVFTVKYRTFILWEDDTLLEDSRFEGYIQKALDHGHYYHLKAAEAEEFQVLYEPFPKLWIFNQISAENVDAPDIRIFGGIKDRTAISINQSYIMSCRQLFRFHQFPFDLQTIVLDVCLRDSKVWNHFELIIDSVQFEQQCLEQIEWDLCVPIVKKGEPASLNSMVHLPILRKSSYYLQNIIVITIILPTLGLSTFAFPSDDLTGRTFIVFTLILTCIAFKFTTLQGAIPKVSYSTIMDYFLTFSIWSLALMTVFTILPKFYIDQETAQGYILDNLLNLILSMVSIGVLVLGFGGLLVYVVYLRYYEQCRNCQVIPLQFPLRPWYSFRYTNSEHLTEIVQERDSLEQSLMNMKR